jgi:hypothetical protein
LARRAALMEQGKLGEKANQRFDSAALAAISRIFARDASMRVGEEGMRWLSGCTAGISAAEIAALESAINLPAIHQAQAGLMGDMDLLADVLYGRVARSAGHAA